MNVHRIRPEVFAYTRCPNGHTATVGAIDPHLVGNELVDCNWPSAHDYCLDCDLPVQVTSVEVLR